jgi:hypothetical protein
MCLYDYKHFGCNHKGCNHNGVYDETIYMTCGKCNLDVWTM